MDDSRSDTETSLILPNISPTREDLNNVEPSESVKTTNSDNHNDVAENNYEKNAAGDSADEAQCDEDEASKESEGKDSGEGPSLIPFP
ncbi:MAG: hypothetical protein GEU26_18100 [Nitrososphaeraceae archaeon]|nr:hypothetical protein [Nitrososphaeraceae archaeon]